MSTLSEITERLEEIAAELSDEGTDDERASALTAEAAKLASEATEQVALTLRETAADE